MLKIIDIAIKNTLRSFRSLFAVGMMVIAPLLITGLMYFAFSGMAGDENGGVPDLPDFKVLVVNQDMPVQNVPALGNLLVDFLKDERMPDWLVIQSEQSFDLALEQVNRQNAGSVLVIPEDFSASLLAGAHLSTVRLIHDPTLTVGPQVLVYLIGQFTDGVMGTAVLYQTSLSSAGDNSSGEFLQQAAGEYAGWYAAIQNEINHGSQPLVRLSAPGGAKSQPTNPLSGILANTMAGMLVFFVFFTGANASQSILKEDEEGTLARLFSTPTPRSAILAGQYLSVWFVIVVQSIVLLIASALVFGIDWGRPFPLILAVAGCSVAATGFGVFLISLLKNTRQAGPVIGGVLSASGMLGGLFTVSITNLPEFFKTINLMTPQGWAMKGIQIVLGDGSAGSVAGSCGIMLVWGIMFFAAGALLFKRRFA